MCKFFPFCHNLLAHKPSSALAKEQLAWLYTLFAMMYVWCWKYCSLTQLPLCITGVPCLMHSHHSNIMLPIGAVTTPIEIPCWTFSALLLHIDLPVRVSRGSIQQYCPSEILL